MSSLKHTVKKNFPGLFRGLSAAKQAWRNKKVAQQCETLIPKVEKDYASVPEAKEVLSYLKSDGIAMIPYAFRKEYDKINIEVKNDPAVGLDYVVLNGRNIYFPKGTDHKYIIDSARVGLVEQDARSPHRYLPVGGHEIYGDMAIVCGASDCIYTLEIIDKFRKIYLFEANDSWVPAIRATLKGYESKYEIIPYYVSDKDGDGMITLDTFFSDKPGEVNYLQADIEGAEQSMLRGATKVLSTAKRLDLSLCCYHTAQQEPEITKILTDHGYSVRPSNGFLLMWMEYPLNPPYLRRGVLYGSKASK